MGSDFVIVHDMSIVYRFRSRGDANLKEVPTHRAGAWIQVTGISPEDIKSLVEKHGLEEGHLTDAQDFFESPRFEKEGKDAYFFTRFPEQLDGEMSTAPILIVVGEDFVLSVTHKKLDWLEKLVEREDVYTTQKSKFFLQILNTIEKEYLKVFNSMRKDVRRARITVRDVSEKTIEESVHLEYALNEFVSALVPTNTALQQVIAGKHLQLFEEDLEFVEDVQLANNQLIESAKNVLKTIQNIRAAHAALVSNRLNQVVRILTAITILLTIPTIVGTLFGMNIPLPLQENPDAFLLIIGFVLCLVAGVTYLFVHKKWL